MMIRQPLYFLRKHSAWFILWALVYTLAALIKTSYLRHRAWFGFWLLLGLLGILLALPDTVHPAETPAPVFAPPEALAPPQTLEEIALFSWGPGKCTAYHTIDLADFDTDPKTGEIYRRITNFRIDCPLSRGASFDFKNKDVSKRVTTWTDKQGRFNIPLIVTRVTEQDFGWNYTPDHVDIKKGSVSNPSLLTSGGNATSNTSDTTAAFTPTANSLLVMGWSAAKASGAAATFTYTNTHAGSGAWVAVEAFRNDGPSARHGQARSQNGASPGSGTVTTTYSAASNRKSWI